MNKVQHVQELRKGNRSSRHVLKKYKGTKRAKDQRAIKEYR